MSRFPAAVTALGIALAGCRSSPHSATAGRSSDQQARGTATTSPQEEPDTTPPADVSHGEAPIGGPACRQGVRPGAE
ncbi:MAG: hypothetical protein ACREM9_06985 [Gemmatimonadales bacterium]